MPMKIIPALTLISLAKGPSPGFSDPYIHLSSLHKTFTMDLGLIWIFLLLKENLCGELPHILAKIKRFWARSLIDFCPACSVFAHVSG